MRQSISQSGHEGLIPPALFLRFKCFHESLRRAKGLKILFFGTVPGSRFRPLDSNEKHHWRWKTLAQRCEGEQWQNSSSVQKPRQAFLRHPGGPVRLAAMRSRRGDRASEIIFAQALFSLFLPYSTCTRNSELSATKTPEHLKFVAALRKDRASAVRHHIRVRERQAATENGVEKKSPSHDCRVQTPTHTPVTSAEADPTLFVGA